MKRAVCALLLAASMGYGERPGGFTVVGPGGGGAMFAPLVSPHDARLVVVACDMTGSYVSRDGGESWRMFNLRGVTRRFVFDPVLPDVIYALGTGLWRSGDRGGSWSLVWPRPDTVTGVAMPGDHADERIAQKGEAVMGPAIAALAIDAKDSQKMYAVAGEGGRALFVSRDGGKSWAGEGVLPMAANRLWLGPEGLLAGGAEGVAWRAPGGEWALRPAPEGVKFVDVSAGFPAGGGAPYVYGAGQGAWVSRDGGVRWEKVELGGAEVRAIATSLRHPETAYLSYGKLQREGRAWLGVARTTDGGRTWALVWKEGNGAPAANVRDAWIAPAMGVDWGENPLAMTVADQDARLVYGTDFGRTMRSTDGGATWKGVYSRKVEGAGWTTTGLDVTTAYGYHIDPFDRKRHFISYTDIGLFRSEDGGASWERSVEGAPRAWTNTTYWVEFDAKVRGRMWAVMSGTHDLPRPKMWRRTPTERYRGGIVRSDDGGRTWKTPEALGGRKMDEMAATHVVLDPASPVERRVLYVAATGRGVYKSEDGGVTWVERNKGIEQARPLAWRLTMGGGALYLVVARRSERGEMGDAGDGALYRSRDGAATWERMRLPAGVNGPNGLAVDPGDPKRLYLAAWGRAAGERGEGGGIWASEDGGASWKCVFGRDQHVYDVTVDGENSSILYACGFESSAWRSVDRGASWARVSGYNFKWGHRVMVDPGDASLVYITTFGGSVWKGRVGAAARPLDIVTGEMDPGR